MKIDKDGNGMISLKELLQGFEQFGSKSGIKLSESQLTDIFK